MNNEIIKMEKGSIVDSDWYRLLVDDCGAIVTEASFIARQTIIEGYHALGLRVKADMSKFEEKGIYGKGIVKMVSGAIRRGERSLYYAMQFVEQYPDVNLLPEGKNLTWSKLCKVYLSGKGECPHEIIEEVVIKVCKGCKKKMSGNCIHVSEQV